MTSLFDYLLTEVGIARFGSADHSATWHEGEGHGPKKHMSDKFAHLFVMTGVTIVTEDGEGKHFAVKGVDDMVAVHSRAPIVNVYAIPDRGYARFREVLAVQEVRILA